MKRQWNAEEMKEAARDARRALEREREHRITGRFSVSTKGTGTVPLIGRICS